MKIIQKNSRLEISIKDTASIKEYEKVILFLMNNLKLKDIGEVDDFDEHYQIFEYKGYHIVLFYSHFLGLSLYFQDNNISRIEQTQILKDFFAILSNLEI